MLGLSIHDAGSVTRIVARTAADVEIPTELPGKLRVYSKNYEGLLAIVLTEEGVFGADAYNGSVESLPVRVSEMHCHISMESNRAVVVTSEGRHYFQRTERGWVALDLGLS